MVWIIDLCYCHNPFGFWNSKTPSCLYTYLTLPFFLFFFALTLPIWILPVCLYFYFESCKCECYETMNWSENNNKNNYTPIV